MLIQCSECGISVSDKAIKCPKCGKNMVQESCESIEYGGIIQILNKVADIRSKFPNFWVKLSVYPDNFSIDPLIEVITDQEDASMFSVQINEEDLKKMNLVSNFEALDYYDGFTSNGNPDDPYKWVDVNDTKVAAKTVYEILTKVYQKKHQAARFVITGVEDDLNKAKYNSSGEFLEGEGYGQGEFAYYKEPEYSQDVQEYNEADGQEENNASKYIWYVIGFIVWLIWMLL